ncbi:MAG: hypothetical protein ACTHNY_02760 [Solirubrobacterales bacterium]
MLFVSRANRIVLLVLGLALLFAAPAGANADGGRLDLTDGYWLGPYFAGLRLTHTEGFNGTTFSYGDCEFPKGEGGCSVPAQVQTTSSCDRNPLAIDRLPFRVFPVRGGGIGVEYERSGIDITTGGQTVTLYVDFELMTAALRDFRRRTEPSPIPLAPPIYPPDALRELKRVTVAKERFGQIDAIARAIHLPPEEVEVRLQIADLLPPETLAGVKPPTLSTAAIERLRQLAFRTQGNLSRAARIRGISKAALLRKIAPVRGLTGECWPVKAS